MAHMAVRISLICLVAVIAMSTADHHLPARCLETPALQGTCEADLTRYTFKEQPNPRCESFTYGGCDGNGNNFLSLEECQEHCMEAQHQHDE